MTSAFVSDEELARLNREFEDLPSAAVMEWASTRFGHDLVVASSFQNGVIIDVATKVDPNVEVVFLDTGFHFPETLEFLESVRERYQLQLSVLLPGDGAEAWPCGTAACCEFRKVKPLKQFLKSRKAWVTGLRRAETPTRARVPILGIDEKFQVIKINPLATWSDADLEQYIDEQNIAVHPLTYRGYTSIGCAPTTAPVPRGSDMRSGRWPGQGKTECGLHF